VLLAVSAGSKGAPIKFYHFLTGRDGHETLKTETRPRPSPAETEMLASPAETRPR